MPNAAAELLQKQYKRKPKRTLKSDVALAQQEFSVNNPYFERPATARVSDAVHKWLDTALTELDAPTNMPEHPAIDARVWKRYSLWKHRPSITLHLFFAHFAIRVGTLYEYSYKSVYKCGYSYKIACATCDGRSS